MSQRGFITLPFTAWIAIAASVAFLGMGIALKLQSLRLASCKQEFTAFQADVRAKGEAAIAEAKRKEAEDKAKKEKIDRENKRLRADNVRIAGELRDARSRSRYVPEAAPGARNPDRATFDRAELESAIQRLDAGVSGIVAEGDADRIDLNAAREWARR